MKQEISALMDGELFEDQADACLDKLKRSTDAKGDWACYHLIGDALRQPEHLSKSFGKSFHERLNAEPTVIAPRARTTHRVRNIALSAAASVLAVALVVWMSVQVGNEPTPQMASAQIPQPNAVKPASLQANDYLMAHQEFSPSAEVRVSAPYIHAVAGR